MKGSLEHSAGNDLPGAISDTILGLFGVTHAPFRYLYDLGGSYRISRFGALKGSLLYFSGLVDIDSLEATHLAMNFWTDEELIAWKNSFIASLNAISVAVGDSSSVKQPVH